jgi:hypothetical protein
MITGSRWIEWINKQLQCLTKSVGLDSIQRFPEFLWRVITGLCTGFIYKARGYDKYGRYSLVVSTAAMACSQPPPPSVLRTSRDIGRVLEPSLAIVLLGYVAAGEEGGT